MAANRITARDLSGMAEHWLRTPVNGYLGSSYGSEVKALLHTPMAAGLADGVLAKLRQDVPLIQAAPAGSVNLYAQDADFETKLLTLEIAGELVDVNAHAFAGELGAYTASTASADEALTDVAVDSLHHLLHVTMPSPGYW